MIGIGGTGATVEVEPGLLEAAIGSRLDTDEELAVEEGLARVVEQHRVDPVAVGHVHAGAEEGVLPAVGVEIADAQSPGPVVLGADSVGDLLELATAEVPVEGVAEHVVGPALKVVSSLQVIRDLSFSKPGRTSRLMSECMSVMNRSCAPSLSKSKNFTPIAPQEVLAKNSSVLSTKRSPPIVLVVVVVALHVENVEIGEAIAVDVRERRVTAPAAVDEPHLLRDVPEPTVAEVAVQDAGLGALGEEMAAEGVFVADVVAAPTALLRGVAADVGQEEVERTVPVVVEEDAPEECPTYVDPACSVTS